MEKDLYLDEAFKFFSSGEYDKAIEFLNKAIVLDSNDANAYH